MGMSNPIWYQTPQDQVRERQERGGLLRKLFGPFQDDIWKMLAEDVGGQFVKRGFWDGGKVVATVGEWQVVLDTAPSPSGSQAQTVTRLRAPYLSRDGLTFTVYRAGLLSDIGKLFGMQDVEIGEPFFDRMFVIKSNNEDQVRRLFANERLRKMLRDQPDVRFIVKDDEGYFRHLFPGGVHELEFLAENAAKDLHRLRSLFELFAETLHTLCHIGSAYESDPRLGT